MSPSPSIKLQLKNPLLSLLQKSKNVSKIHQIHAQLITTGLISDTFATSRLIVAVTSNASTMDYSSLVFSRIQKPHTFIWNSMIKGYVQNSKPGRALEYFRRMRRECVNGDFHTYPFVLKACGLMVEVKVGRGVHGEVVKIGMELDLFVRNGLISMYCRCGEIVCARSLFDDGGDRDLISWNTMVGGFVEMGEMDEAQKLFDEMPERDLVSWTMMIDGYGKRLGDVARARELFNNMPKRDLVSWNSMIAGYTHVGDMVGARDLFERMAKKNVISWSIMIDGYARHADPIEALKLFQEMLSQGIRVDKVSVMGAIQACGQLGALDQGRWIHTYIERKEITADVMVHTALLDMYMKCGSLSDARLLFNSMLQKNFVSWNVMIVGLGINGCGNEAVELFNQMVEQGILIDELTFLGVLSACNHAGLVNEGFCIFGMMKNTYGIKPKVEHYSCLVDLLSRAGRVEEAMSMIQSMPVKTDSALWGSLLAGCRTNSNLTVAEASLEKIMELKEDDSGSCVLMSNIYAEKRMWPEVLRMRRQMTHRRIKKETGRSVIELDGNVHEFINGDGTQFLMEDTKLVLWSLLKVMVCAR